MATPNEISEASPCFSCIESKADALLYLLDQIRIEGGGSAMTANEISEASTCFSCISDKWAAGLYLAEQIVANGGGGGGGSAVLSTVGDPEGVLTADERQFAWDATNNILYIHEGADGTNTGWREVVAS